MTTKPTGPSQMSGQPMLPVNPTPPGPTPARSPATLRAGQFAPPSRREPTILRPLGPPLIKLPHKAIGDPKTRRSINRHICQHGIGREIRHVGVIFPLPFSLAHQSAIQPI
jgi:hypothetical protein